MITSRFAIFVATAFWLACTGAARAQNNPKQAQAWFDASVAQAGKPGHFIALVQVERDGKMVADFRYDRLGFDKSAEIERVVTPDGLAFARNAGKAWVASWNWGRSGDDATAEQSAALDGMVEFALRALQPPADAGAAWKPVKDEPCVFERAAKADSGGDGSAARFEFTGNRWEIAGTLLRKVTATWKWEGAPAKVSVYYFYLPQEQPQQVGPQLQQGGPQSQQGGPQLQPDGPLPEEQIAEALTDARSRPVKVDVVMALNERAPRAVLPAIKPSSVRVAGIISGKDFDLTVVKDGVASRQIALGNDSWTSRDDGRTWQKQAAADRTYYDAAHRVIGADNPGWAIKLLFNDGLPAPVMQREVLAGFEAVHPPANGAAAQKTDGEKPRRLSFKFFSGNKSSEDLMSYWVEMKGGKPVLRCVTGRIARDRTEVAKALRYFAQYGDVAGDRGVLAPPGNPEAVPSPRGDDLLAAAVKAMDGKMWRADLQMDEQVLRAGVWGGRSPTGHEEGLISGNDFDITYENGSDRPERDIGIGGKVWVGGDIAGTWTTESQADFGSEEQASARDPLEWWFTLSPYDIVGKETHGGETWLHIHNATGQEVFAADTVDYWLLLDGKGNPVAVRRCEWSGIDVGEFGVPSSPGPPTRGFEQVDYTPAKESEKIAPPPGS